MKQRTNVKAGPLGTYQTSSLRGLKVRTKVQAGRLAGNHNQVLVRSA